MRQRKTFTVYRQPVDSKRKNLLPAKFLDYTPVKWVYSMENLLDTEVSIMFYAAVHDSRQRGAYENARRYGIRCT